MIKNDYIMNEINNLIRFFKRLVSIEEEGEEIFDREVDYRSTSLYKDIFINLDMGKINKAENILFEYMDKHSLEYLKLGLDFYTSLNNLSDEELEASQFSREEVYEGLLDFGRGFELDVPFLK